MKLVGVLLGILSVVLIIAPVGAVVIMYQNDLTQLVIPPEINDLVNGDVSSFLVPSGVSGGSGDSFLGDSPLTSLIVPEFVGADLDLDANKFTINIDISNNVDADFVLDTFGTEIRSPDGYHIVTVAIPQAITLESGQTSLVTVIGSWTDEAEAYMIEHYMGASSAQVELVNTTIGVNGVTVTLSEPISIDIPISLGA